MKKENKPTVDLNAALQSQGLTFKGRTSTGDILVEDSQDGSEKELNFNGILETASKQLNAKPDDIEFEFNSPDSALNISPLSVTERAKLKGFGNEKGKLNWLKSKYSQVGVSENNGLVVKDKDGVWKDIDPSGLDSIVQDPWELAKDLADLVDIGQDIAVVGTAAAKGAAAGAAAGSVIPGVGTAAGAVAGGIAGAAGGQAISSTIRTSLGRILGTYEATPEENIKDVAMDTLFALGGAGLGAGVRPTAKAFGRAMKKISRSASPAVKKSIAGLAGFMDGTKARRKLIAIDKPDEMLTEMKGALRQGIKEGKRVGADPILQAEQVLSRKIAEKTTQLANEAIKGQQLRYQRGLRQILQSPEAKGLKVNLDEIADNVFKKINESGLGVVEKKGGKLFLRPPEGQQIIQALTKGVVRQETQTNLNQIQNALRVIDRFKGNVEGKQAANALISLQQTMNGLKKNIDPVQGKNIIRVLAEIDSQVKTAVSTKLGPKLGQEFGTLNNQFGSFSQGTDIARQIRAGKLDPENFVNKALDRSLNRSETEALDTMIKAAGKRGLNLVNEISLADAAKAHIPLSPKMGLIQTASAMGPLIAGAEAALKKAGTVLGISSPRLQAAAFRSAPVKVTSKSLGVVNDTLLRSSNFLARLPKNELDRVLSDPTLFNAAVIQPIADAAKEDARVLKLLQQSGAIVREGPAQ